MRVWAAVAVAFLLGVAWFQFSLAWMRRDYVARFQEDCRLRLMSQSARAGKRQRVVVLGSSLVGCGVEAGAVGDRDFLPVWHTMADAEFFRDTKILDLIESARPDVLLVEDNLVEIQFLPAPEVLSGAFLSEQATRAIRAPLTSWGYGRLPSEGYGPRPTDARVTKFRALSERRPRTAMESLWLESRLQSMRRQIPGLKVVLVDFPVDPQSLPLETQGQRLEREATLGRFQSLGIEHWSLNSRLEGQDLGDAGHLSREGAHRFTGWLHEKLSACAPSS